MTPTPSTQASLLFRLHDSQDHEAWVEFVEIYEPPVYRQLRKCGLLIATIASLLRDSRAEHRRHVKKITLRILPSSGSALYS